MSNYIYPQRYGVIVIGAGHAGVEAALAASRLGCKVAILTQNLDTVGQMSCNPAIGGLGKGHMVREIDALGGAMGMNTDATGIQFRTLNASKGPSVRAPRAQCDKKAYQFRMKYILENEENLHLHQGNVAKIIVKKDKVCGITTNLGIEYHADTIIVSSGTFMRGLMHVGKQNQAGGRMGDGVSTLSDSLKDLGFEIDRFKTGTPCRLNGRSIDFSCCEKQIGDDPPPRFSFMPDQIGHGNAKDKPVETFTLNNWSDPLFHMEQLPCWITYTNPNTHEIIRSNLDQSPMYGGIIEGVGPRYCPSIEDKVVRFEERERHQVFLEPEGRQTNEYYVNGVSTSLPFSVQHDFIRSIKGLENAEIIRPGYAVEYDYCTPTQLYPTLETKIIEGLFFAGQINGTSGYEEAAGQGLVAGTNAALKSKNLDAFILSRSESYLGVMVDDLVTKGVTEPYRMFTSRAEYRLLLRQDNADIRLTEIGDKFGLVGKERIRRNLEKKKAFQDAQAFCRKTNLEGLKIDVWFRKPNNGISTLPNEIKKLFDLEVWKLVEIEFQNEGYIARQQLMIERASGMEGFKLPNNINYDSISGLKKEAVLRLEQIKPKTLGQASRISGITPADISVISIWIKKESIND